jgi:hypothetical protein
VWDLPPLKHRSSEIITPRSVSQAAVATRYNRSIVYVSLYRLLAIWSTTMRISWLRCPLILFAVCAACVAPRDAKAEPITLDFSEPGVGPFDPNYFGTKGVLFQPGLSVGFVQGDEALISNSFGPSGPFAHSITGRFASEIEVASISIRVALTFQYVSDLTLGIFDRDTNLINRTILRLNQIEGDPGFMGFGYHTVDVTSLTRPASFFVILNQFVRSPTAVGSEFGVSEIAITPVPEPSAVGLLALGLAATGVLRRMRSNRPSLRDK